MDFDNPQCYNDPKVFSNGNVVFHDPSNSKVFEDPKLISYGDMDFDIKKNCDDTSIFVGLVIYRFLIVVDFSHIRNLVIKMLLMMMIKIKMIGVT